MKLCPRCEESFADDAGFCPFDGEALAKSADPLLGRTLGARYRLVRRLGSGGMAIVYLARHVMIERQSAVKVLRPDLGLNPTHRERFLREARAVNRINHDNIVQITDFGEDRGIVFLVMELITGESLASAMTAGPMPWLRAARIGMQIAAALGRVHELGVIHRDLKPENVLLAQRDGNEIVKLSDFGIAKIVDAPALTFSEQRFGTPGYIAPEYVSGAVASPLGDLYAFGIVLYQMLTGTLPYDARFPAELLVLPTRVDPIRPSARVSGIPPELEELVLRMIARRPDLRPANAFAVHDVLEELLTRSGVQSSAVLVSDRATDVARSADAGGPVDRWRAGVEDLRRRAHAAVQTRGPADRRVRTATDLIEVAMTLVSSLERAAVTVTRHQARVDQLEAEGGSFRATLGRAIDALSHDRSRSRALLSTVAERRAEIERDASAAKPDARRADAFVWALAAVSDQEERARATDADLGFQIETLERQLEIRNEQLETDLTDATGRLEGSLSAVRRISRELGKTMHEARAALA